MFCGTQCSEPDLLDLSHSFFSCMGLPQPAMQMIYFLATCYPDPGTQAKKLFFWLCACSGVSSPHYSPLSFSLIRGRGRHLTQDMFNAICNNSSFFKFLSLALLGRPTAFRSSAVVVSVQSPHKTDEAENHVCQFLNAEDYF